MVRQVLLCGVLGAAVAACTHPMIPEDASRAYAAGWDHGCNSGYAEAGRQTHEFAGRKDNARYGEDAEYTDGWDAGYAHCLEEENRMPWMGGPGAVVI